MKTHHGHRISWHLLRLAWFLFLPGLCITVSAQVKTETKEARFRIDSVFTRHDSLLVLVPGSKAAGVQPGLFVKCFSAYKEINGEEISSKEIGFGTVIEAGNDMSVCAVSLYNEIEGIQIGDHVLINLNLPVLSYESLLNAVSLSGIEFVYIDKTPFYTLNDFIVAPVKQSEDAIKASMVEDIHAAYEKVKDRTNLPPALYALMDKGRYRGKTSLQVLRDVTVADLNNFLLYVKTYPAKYVGKIYRLSESFIGWVVSNSPYSSEEVKQLLLPWYKNKPELAKRIVEYESSIRMENHVVSFGAEAFELAENKKITEANQLLQFATAIADVLKDTVGIISLHLSGAQILQEQEKYKEAIAYCDKAIGAAVLVSNTKTSIYKECKRLELAAMIKKGFCQYQMSMYNEGLVTLAEAGTRIKKYGPLLDKNDLYHNLQKISEFLGWINYSSGEYNKAISHFQHAITINDSINTYDSRTRNAIYFKRIGNVYKDQGKYKESLEVYLASLGIYKGLNDKRNELLVQVDIGEVYYYLSENEKGIEYLRNAQQGLMALNDFDNAGYASSLTGSAYMEAGKYDSSILSHQTSIALRKLGKRKEGQAFSWNQLGDLYLKSGQKTAARTAYDSSIFYYSKIPDKAGIADNHNSIGNLFLNDENFKTAVEYFEKAKGNNRKTTVEALYNLAIAWMPIDAAKAKDYFLQSKKISIETGNDMYTFLSLINLSKLAYIGNDFKAGSILYDSVATMARNYGTARAEAIRLDLKAFSYVYKLELDSAISLYAQAVAIYDTVDQDNAVWERISLTDALISKGEFRQAESILLKGIQIADSISGMLALGSSYVSSSFLYGLLGEYEKGMAANEKASLIYDSTGNNFRQAAAFLTRGNLYKIIGEFKKSIEAYLVADSIYKAEKTEEFRSVVFNNIGVTYFNQGDYAKAIDYFKRAEKYFKPGLVDENYLLNRSNLAECYYYLKRNKEAEKILLAIFPVAQAKKFDRIGSTMAATLGKIYFDEKQFTRAGQYLETARKLSLKNQDKEQMVDALIHLAKLRVVTGDDAEAEKLLQEAVKLSREYSVSSQSWIVFYESGLLFYRQKKYDKAINDFKAAVEIIEKNSNNVYGGEDARKIYRNDPRKVDLYGKLVVSLAEAGNTGEAWTYANRSNMTGIKELMGSMVNQTGDAVKDAALEQARSLSQKTEALAKKETELKSQPQSEQIKAQLQSIEQEKEIAESDFIKYTENLLAKYTDLKENFYDNVNPVDFENYKGVLPADMAVLLYVINDNKLLIFSLTNEKLGITPVELKEDMTKTIREYAALLRAPSKASGTGSIHVRSTIEGEEDNIDISKLSFTDISEKMYRLVISPVYSGIAGKKKLCIIPNGDLGNIPFQAMGHKLPDGSFRFLVEDHMVFYTSRMKIFDVDPPALSAMSSFAIFGVPDKTLKFTEKEAVSIGDIMRVPEGVYTEKKATEQQAKQSLIQKKYIHFATHGILNYSDYNASYLKFLPSADTSGGNNGRLTIDEIYRLNIAGCELVTLSACETAVSRQKTKGWNISPANSLLRKRVKAVIATMWKVDDEATSILMDEFYRLLISGKEKGEALRLAQEKLSRDIRYKHPYFWSAFVLYGDWR